jgi:hypothetical protein
MAGPLVLSNPLVMRRLEETHLFTERGALCGARTPFHWSLSEARVTCATCRSLFDTRAEERREARRRQPPVPLARLTKGE